MTLDQLRTIYTLADLCDIHEAMREWDDAQDEARRVAGEGVDGAQFRGRSR